MMNGTDDYEQSRLSAAINNLLRFTLPGSLLVRRGECPNSIAEKLISVTYAKD